MIKSSFKCRRSFIILNLEHNQAFSSSPKILSFLLDLSPFFSITMTKMVTRLSPNKGHDSDSPPKSQNLLKSSSSELCRFTDPEVDQFFTRFPPNTVFRSFDSLVKSDSVSSTWVCFPVAAFQIGYSYPFPEFT
ncbi:hypothetical protein Hanom_Chr15g01369221 [Helianthus anomalus]